MEIQSEETNFTVSEERLINFAKKLYHHLQKEEEVFYKPLLEKSEDWKEILKSFEEHKLIEETLEKVSLKTTYNQWLTAFSEFSAVILAHIENEEVDAFELAKQTFTRAELNHFGKLYLQYNITLAP